MFWQFMLVGLGGALGAMSRFGVQQLGIFEHDKYYYTLGINLSGCFAIGVAWALLGAFEAPRWVYQLAITGFLGGYTTYSAFSLDAVQLFDAGRPWEGVFYLGATFLGGLLFCWIGWWATQRIIVAS